jgi:hypothetical protein
LWFLKKLKPSLATTLRDIVITMDQLEADDDGTRSAWDAEGGGLLFTHVLDESFPNLSNLFIQVPLTSEAMKRYYQSALGQLCELLSVGRIQVLRFFYVGPGDFTDTEHLLHKYAGPLSSDSGDEPPGREYEPTSVSRKFDVVDEATLGAMHPSWKMLHASRVLRVTRWKDTKLGCDTYTHWDFNYAGRHRPNVDQS